MTTTFTFDLVGFDADYTLIDPRPGRKAALEALFAEHGIAVSVEGAIEQELYALSARGVIAGLLAENPAAFGGMDEALAWERFVELEQAKSGATVLMPGALDAFYGSLGRNTIISRSPTDLLMRRMHGALDNALAGLTDAGTPDVAGKVGAIKVFLHDEQAKLSRGEPSVIVAADSATAGRGKPFGDPVTAAFSWLSEVLGLSYVPARCLLAGDSNEDAYSGILAGVMTVRAQVSDGILGDVYVLPDAVREHLTVPDLTGITLRRAGGAVTLTTEAEVRRVDMMAVNDVLRQVFGGQPLAEAKNWPKLAAATKAPAPGDLPPVISAELPRSPRATPPADKAR